ncbi:Putative riboflavin synthase alpha chain [Mycobacteroides abscessus subsp. abscessus]|nr:Putative riboflavin synthase alpha chain [Mycobacteroides abscessus subsp. abscessus]
MFTGIIDHLGTVETLERTGDAARLRLRAGDLIRDLPHGGSLAVDGVCLTAVPDPEAGEGVFLADVMGDSPREMRSTWNAACRPAGASTGTSCRATWTAPGASWRSPSTPPGPCCASASPSVWPRSWRRRARSPSPGSP